MNGMNGDAWWKRQTVRVAGWVIAGNNVSGNNTVVVDVSQISLCSDTGVVPEIRV